MKDYNLIKTQAKSLVDKHGKKAIDIVNRKIASFGNQFSKESDIAFLLLNEVEKLASNLD